MCCCDCCHTELNRISLEEILGTVREIHGGSFISHNLDFEPYEADYDGYVLIIMGDLSMVEHDDDRVDGGYILERDLEANWAKNIRDQRVVELIQRDYPNLPFRFRKPKNK